MMKRSGVHLARKAKREVKLAPPSATHAEDPADTLYRKMEAEVNKLLSCLTWRFPSHKFYNVRTSSFSWEHLDVGWWCELEGIGKHNFLLLPLVVAYFLPKIGASR